MSPLYDHDCPYCKYLGIDTPAPGEPQVNAVDMYICVRDKNPNYYSIIRRYSSEPNDYGCTELLAIFPGSRYESAKRAAIKQGVVTEE
ncbi:MAG: hypothetical protein C0P72_011270 [Clostridia bacterium]